MTDDFFEKYGGFTKKANALSFESKRRRIIYLCENLAPNLDKFYRKNLTEIITGTKSFETKKINLTLEFLTLSNLIMGDNDPSLAKKVLESYFANPLLNKKNCPDLKEKLFDLFIVSEMELETHIALEKLIPYISYYNAQLSNDVILYFARSHLSDDVFNMNFPK